MVTLGPHFYGASGPAVAGQPPRGRGSWTAHRHGLARQSAILYGPSHYAARPSGLALKVTAQPARRFRFIRGLMGIGVYTVNQVPRIVWRDVQFRDGFLLVTARLDLPGGLLIVVEQGARVVAFRESLTAALEHRMQVPVPAGISGRLTVHLETVVV